MKDSTVVVVRAATAWNRHEYTPAEVQRITAHAEIIRRYFAPPSTLGALPVIGEARIPAWGGVPFVHSAIHSRLALVVTPEGRIRTAFWQIPPVARPLAQAVTAAVTRADSSGAFRSIPRTHTLLHDDTLVVQLRAVTRTLTGDDFPLMRARLERLEVDTPTRLVRNGRMVHPAGVMYARGENFGEIIALVGSDGVVVQDGSQISRIERPGFVRTMRHFVSTTTYEPARSGRCTVASLYLHCFDFASER